MGDSIVEVPRRPNLLGLVITAVKASFGRITRRCPRVSVPAAHQMGEFCAGAPRSLDKRSVLPMPSCEPTSRRAILMVGITVEMWIDCGRFANLLPQQTGPLRMAGCQRDRDAGSS